MVGADTCIKTVHVHVRGLILVNTNNANLGEKLRIQTIMETPTVSKIKSITKLVYEGTGRIYI